MWHVSARQERKVENMLMLHTHAFCAADMPRENLNENAASQAA